MKRSDDYQELWRDTLDEGLPGDFAGESLARMLGSTRRRKYRKLAMKAGLGTAIVLVGLFLLLQRTPPAATESTAPALAQTVPATPPPVPPPAAEPKAVVVESIGDEELLAAFGGRPVALVGAGDAKQIVLLNQKKR